MEIRIIRIMSKSFLIPLLVLLWTLTPKWGFSDLNEWSLLGLENESIMTLVIFPDNPNIMIAGSHHDFGQPYTGGIFRSINGGAVWDTVALRGISVWKITMNPSNCNTLYASTDDGIYRSYDIGVSWHFVSRFGLGPTASGYAVAVDPNDSLHLMVGTGGPAYGLLGASTDGGTSWNLIQYGVFEGISFHPTMTNRVYAWGQCYCYQSIDSGYTWDEWYYRQSGFSTIVPSALSNRIWICSDHLVWTDDFGDSWNTAMGASFYLYALIEEVLDDTTVAVGALDGAYLIHDPLSGWEYLGTGNPLYGCRLLGYSHEPRTLYGTFYHGFWDYTFGNNSFQMENNTVISNLQIYPNPFINDVSIVLPLGVWEISLYNILGRKVNDFHFNALQQNRVQSWQLGHLSSGTYFLLIHSTPPNVQQRKWVSVIQKLK